MIALLKAKIGSSSLRICCGTFFKSVSRPTQRNERFVFIWLTNSDLFITIGFTN